MRPVMSSDAQHVLDTAQQDKKIMRSNAGKILRLFARDLKQLGYSRKGTFFSREAGPIAQFLHVHKFSFGPCYRIHVCVRILNDSRPFLGLIGIASDEYDEFRSTIDFDESPESIEQCRHFMARFVCEVAEPWFKQQTAEVLVEPSSILLAGDRAALKLALSGDVNDQNVQRSKLLLGLS